MFETVSTWYHRYFTDRQAVILFFLLFFGFVIVLVMGHMLAPVLAAIVIAYVLEWLIAHLERWRIPRSLALFVVYLVFLGALAFIVLGMLPLLWQQASKLFDDLPTIIGRWQESLQRLPDSYPEFISTEQVANIISIFREEGTRFGQYLITASISSIVNLIFIVVYLIIVPLMVFFFLKDSEQILCWCASYLPKERQLLSTVWDEMHLQLGNYVRGKVAEILIVGIVSYIAFAYLDLKYAILLAASVGISVLIPYVGAAVVTVPIALAGFLQWGLSSDFVWLLVVYGVIQALDGNVLVPLLFSEAVNIHPVAIVLSILVFGGLWGFWGIFFSIPLAILVKTVITVWPRPAKAR